MPCAIVQVRINNTCEHFYFLFFLSTVDPTVTKSSERSETGLFVSTLSIMPRMSANAMTSLIFLCLCFISSVWAVADFDIRGLRRSVKSLGTSFVHEKFMTAQKGEVTAFFWK